MTSEIRSKALSSIKWVTFGNLLPKLITPTVSIYLATILDPTDYGLVAISGTIIGFVNLVQGFGIIDYVGKEWEIDDDKLDTCFYLNVSVAIFAYLLLVVLAFPIASLYSASELIKIIPVVSIVLIFDSVGIVQFAILRREMAFKKLFFRSLIPVIVSLMVTLPLALGGFGVWALIFGQISRSFLTTILYWFLSKWRPRFGFSIIYLKQIVRFGIWNNLERLQEYFSNFSLDILLIGYFATAQVVGIYSVGIHIIGTIFLVLRAPIQNMTLPLLSKFQQDSQMMLQTFIKVISRMMFINFPLIILGINFSTYFVKLVFPDKWANLDVVISLLIIGQGLLLNFGAQREFLKIIGRPDVNPKFVFINLITNILFFSIAAKLGDILFFCIARVLNDVIFMIVQIFIIKRYIGINFRDIFIHARVPMLSSLIMWGVIVLLMKLLEFFNLQMINFEILIVIFSVFTYLLSCFLFDKQYALKIFNELLEVIGIQKWKLT